MKVVASRIECRGFDFHVHLTGETGDEVDAIFEMEGLVPLLSDLRAALDSMFDNLSRPDDSPEFERVVRLEPADSRSRH